MSLPRDPEEQKPQRSPQVQAFEAQLAALRPREDRLDRERLMFLAGQASVGSHPTLRLGQQRRWAWPASLGAVVGGAVAAAVMLLLRPVPTNELAAVPTTPQRGSSVVRLSVPLTHRLQIDLASLGEPLDGRLLTASMTLARGPRPLLAAQPRANADEPLRDAPAIQPSLTTRSLREILTAGPGAAFSS